MPHLFKDDHPKVVSFAYDYTTPSYTITSESIQKVLNAKNRRGTMEDNMGVYGNRLLTIAQGLEIAQNHSWVSPQEAREEFRLQVHTIQERKRDEEELAKLRERVQELEGNLRQ